MTTVTAIYGAVLATIVLAWNVAEFFLDRGKFKVWCMIGRTHPGKTGIIDVGDSGDIRASDNLYWYVTNVGRRPLTLRCVGGIYDPKTKKGFTVPLGSGPKIIPSGSFEIQGAAISADLRDVRYLVAVDGAGKFFYAKRKEVRALRENIHHHYREPSK